MWPVKYKISMIFAFLPAMKYMLTDADTNKIFLSGHYILSGFATFGVWIPATWPDIYFQNLRHKVFLLTDLMVIDNTI